MPTKFEQSKNYIMGRKREQEFVEFLARDGLHVVPVYEAVGVDKNSESPKIWTSQGRIIAPDILGVRKDGAAIFFEIKAKTKPSFRWKGEFRGFYHGVNFDLFKYHYRIIAQQCENFWFIICEENTIPNEDWEPAGERPQTILPGGAPDWNEYEKSLAPGPSWLAIKYSDAQKLGRRQDNWTDGKVGWLWPRKAMQAISI
jgi:hypothetical protein